MRCKVAAAPVSGKARSKVERFLAEPLEVPRSDLVVIRGATRTDDKTLVRGLERAEPRKALLPILS